MHESTTNKDNKEVNKSLIVKIVSIVLIISLAGAVIVALKAKPSSETFDPVSDPNVVQVIITKDGFEPSTIKIKPGTEVKWLNEDLVSHQIASDPYPTRSGLPELFAESPIDKGQSYSFTFKDQGSFPYHDNLNPTTFKGVVEVVSDEE
jgi:plastocyanin